MTEPERATARKQRRNRLLSWAKRLFAVLLLLFVLSTLSFRDRLSFRPTGGPDLALEGTIEGDWKQDEIRFRPTEGAEIAAWPAELRAAWERGEGAPVSRAASRTGAASAFEWEPGMRRAFSEAALPWLCLGLLLLVVAMLGAVTRWWRLLALVGCPTTWRNTLRLTFLGLFFNQVMLGLTGGDVVKAVIVVRENPRARAQALVSVAVDRLLGLFVLLAMCAATLLLSGDAFAEIRPKVLLALGVGIAGALVYVSPHLRRLVRLDALLARLPLGDKLAVVDQALRVYARHPLELGLAVLYSLWNHTFVILGVLALGRGFGLGSAEVSLLEWFALVPVANIVSALPLAPAGWGIGELAYRFLFGLIAAPPALGVAVSVSFRLCQLVLSLVGGLFLLAPGGRAELEEAEAAA